MEDAYLSCALRIRYNISTTDFPAWPEDAMVDDHVWKRKMVDSRNNSDGPGHNPTTPLEQDPYIYIGAGATEDDNEQVCAWNIYHSIIWNIMYFFDHVVPLSVRFSSC